MKKTWVRKTLSVGIMAAGALLMAPAAAQAGGQGHEGYGLMGGQSGITQISSTNLGALNGTQFAAPVTMPVNMNGNAIALGGISSASGAGVNRVAEGSQARRGGSGITQQSGGNVGFLNGTQIAVPVTIPINQNGNADSLFGISSARGSGVNHVTEGAQAGNGGWGNGIAQHSGGNVGFLNGNQIAVPVTIPINQCGNSTSFFGVSSARATCGNFIGGPSARRPWHGGGNRIGGWDNGISQGSFGNVGFLNGNQFAAPFIAPINACGNSLGSLLGSAQSSAVCANGVGMPPQGVFHIRKPAHGHHGAGQGDVQGDDNGGVRGDKGYKKNNGGSAPAVNDDQGYTNDDDNAGDVKGDDSGYGDVKADKAPKATKTPKTPKAPKAHKADKTPKGYGDVQDDTYDNTGGRNSLESTSVSGLTGSLGGLDLLDSLR